MGVWLLNIVEFGRGELPRVSRRLFCLCVGLWAQVLLAVVEFFGLGWWGAADFVE